LGNVKPAKANAVTPKEIPIPWSKPKKITPYDQIVYANSKPVKRYDFLPESSVYCRGSHRENRVCRIKNLCYNPGSEDWFIIKSNTTTQLGVPKIRYRDKLLELGSISNHSAFFWDYLEASPHSKSLRNVTMRYETDVHFLFRRLHPRNIMHNLHDDVIPMYHHIKEHLGGGYEDGLPFSLKSHHLLIVDGHGATDSTRPFEYLSDNPLRFKNFLKQNGEVNVFTCFRDVVVGQGKLTTWYQYGFKTPQGPIPDKNPSGYHIREATQWFLSRIGIPLEPDEMYPVQSKSVVPTVGIDDTEDHIVIMSRKLNRLILNENQLLKDVSKAFNMKAVFLRNEDNSFEQQIKILRKAKIVIGMHGAIMAMIMFCKRGTVVVEMYPYGIPSEHYTPYKTLVSNCFNVGEFRRYGSCLSAVGQ
jgi:protein O-mannose beta-1,4-N-acetylglucosaminyltransferase